MVTVAGNIYGVVLNDRLERSRLAEDFEQKPYNAPPSAPVVYMKPLSSIATSAIAVPRGTGLVASTTVAALISRATTGICAEQALTCIGGMALALDLALPSPSYYRPAVASKNGDARIAFGDFVAPHMPDEIHLTIDGRQAHRWTMDRLLRPMADLIADLSAFLTLQPGDVLLFGLPGDAPTVGADAALTVEADGLPALSVRTAGDGQ